MSESRSIPNPAELSVAGLPLPQLIEFAETITGQVISLHARGMLHGELKWEDLELSGSAVQLPPAAAESFALEEETAPPELRRLVGKPIPRDIAAANEFLCEQNLNVDAERIEVFQIGVVLCHLSGASGFRDYLRSPRTRAQVPREFQRVIDGALGFESEHRFESLKELQNAVRSAGRASQALAETPRPMPEPSSVPDTKRLSAPEIPQTLGGYRVLGKIGSGGMGAVYRAFDPSLGREVAIKVLPRAFAQDEDALWRFRSEASAVAQLVHPNVIPVHACGEEQGQPFFVMPYVPGESLADCLTRERRLPVSEALRICDKCLEALTAAHDLGLVHRDIKPGNILLNRDSGQVLLADFGLVKSLHGERRTASGMILGTVEYLAPEQARGAEVDGRADLYALGVVLYEMLAGRLPFRSGDTTAMLFHHIHEPPAPLVKVAPYVPLRLATIVMRMLEKDPADRYQSAAEVLAEIEAFRGGGPTTVRELQASPKNTDVRPRRPSRFSRRSALAATAVGCLVLAGLFLFARSSDSDPEIPERDEVPVAAVDISPDSPGVEELPPIEEKGNETDAPAVSPSNSFSSSIASPALPATSGRLEIPVSKSPTLVYAEHGSPFVAIDEAVYDLRTSEPVGKILVPWNPDDQLRALSPGGKCLANCYRDKIRNLQVVRFVDCESGELLNTVPVDEAQASFVNVLLEFLDDERILWLGKIDGHLSVRILNARSGAEASYGLADVLGDVQADLHHASGRLVVNDGRKLTVYSAESGAVAADMALPAYREEAPLRLANCIELHYRPDGQELAGWFHARSGQRLLVWNSTGDVVVDKIIDRVPTYLQRWSDQLQWAPDGSGWFLSHQFLLDRQTLRIVWELEIRNLAQPPTHFAQPDRIWSFSYKGRSYQDLVAIKIPQAEIREALQSAEDGETFLKPGDAVSLNLELGDIQFADPSEVGEEFTRLFTKRLADNDISIKADQPVVLTIRYREWLSTGITNRNPMFPTYLTQRRKQQVASSFTAELATRDGNQVLWEQEHERGYVINRYDQYPYNIGVNPQKTLEEYRDSDFERLITSTLERDRMPYLIPQRDDVARLPIETRP